MTRDELITWVEEHGWEPDGYGHFQKLDAHNHHFRLKPGVTSARLEIKTRTRRGSRWVRLRSGYYRDLDITADGQLTGMTQ